MVVLQSCKHWVNLNLMKSYGSLKTLTESELTKLDDYQVDVHPQVPSLVLSPR